MTTFFRLPGRDPASAWTHIFGLLGALIGLYTLLVRSGDSVAQQVSMTIYGVSLVMIFLASSLYHFLDVSPEKTLVLRRSDHAAIYIFIAGTYVPVVTHLMSGHWRIIALSVVGGIALLGAIFKLIWFGAPRWINVALYVGLGWIIVPFAPVILPQFSGSQLGWLIGGGVAYTGGALIYGLKRPNPFPGVFGFHEIWHVFVLLGAAAHFNLVYQLLDTLPPPF